MGPLEIVVHVRHFPPVGLQQLVKHLVRVVGLRGFDAPLHSSSSSSTITTISTNIHTKTALTPILILLYLRSSLLVVAPSTAAFGYCEQVVKRLHVCRVVSVARLVVIPRVVEASVVTVEVFQSVQVPEPFFFFCNARPGKRGRVGQSENHSNFISMCVR